MTELIDRRAFLVGVAVLGLASPIQAQQISRVGILAPGNPTPGTLPTIVVESLQRGLKDLGYLESRNIDRRWWRHDRARDRPPGSLELALELHAEPVNCVLHPGDHGSELGASEPEDLLPHDSDRIGGGVAHAAARNVFARLHVSAQPAHRREIRR